MGEIGTWKGAAIHMQRGRTGSHSGVDAGGLWFQHFYPPADDDQCWCGWTPETITTVTVTAAQHGVMNPDGSWTVEEWEASDAEGKE